MCGFHAGLVRKLATERTEVESIAGLRGVSCCLGASLWDNVGSLWVIGWCHLGFVLGCIANL